MPSLGGWEWVILVVVVVLLFGAKKLPDMARSVGQSARIFKGEMKGMKSDKDKEAAPQPGAATVEPQPQALPPSTPVVERVEQPQSDPRDTTR